MPPDPRVKLLEIELSQPLAPVSLGASGGQPPYPRALCLVRLHGDPLGFLTLTPDPASDTMVAEVEVEQLERELRAQLASSIAAHLRRDGLDDHRAPWDTVERKEPPACERALDVLRAAAPFATVVIATHERPDALVRCLGSLLELDYPNFEIVVVDNAPSTSATRERLQTEALWQRLTYVTEPLQGLAAAHNRGLEVARGAFVAFTDDDVTVDRRWLLELAAGFRRADDVACVTGLIVPAELETHAQLIAEEMWGWGKGFEERVFSHDRAGQDPLFPFTAGTFGSGANMAFDTALLRAAGGFDAATGAGTPARGGDDLAAFLGVISRGHRLVYNPRAFVRHAHHPDFDALERQAFGYGVGLTAYVTHLLLDRPSRALEIMRLLPSALKRLRNPRGPARTPQTSVSASARRAITRAERLGMLCGPVAYLRSRRRVARAG